jgi:hypothetical protein
VLDSVPLVNPRGAVFYHEVGENHLGYAIENFEAEEGLVRPADLMRHAARFSKSAFRHGISKILFDTAPVERANSELVSVLQSP